MYILQLMINIIIKIKIIINNYIILLIIVINSHFINNIFN